MKLDGRIVISGGLGELGRAMAAEVIARGAHAVLLGRRPAESVGAEIEAFGGSRCATYMQAEAANVEAIERVFAEVDDLRAAIANAGVTHPQPFLKITPDAWHETMRVNLDGSFAFCQAAAQAMVDGGRGGSVVLVSSWAQEVPDYGNTAYGISKAGLRALGRYMALELGQYDIRVNTLAIGIADVGMARWHMENDSEYARRALRSVPLNRFATVSDVAKPAVWLCSDDAAYVTGSVLLVDGGASLFRRDR